MHRYSFRHVKAFWLCVFRLILKAILTNLHIACRIEVVSRVNADLDEERR